MSRYSSYREILHLRLISDQWLRRSDLQLASLTSLLSTLTYSRATASLPWFRSECSRMNHGAVFLVERCLSCDLAKLSAEDVVC